MSAQFEFLRSLNIGQYLPLASPIHRLDPRARLVGLFFLVMAFTFTHSGWGVILGALLALTMTRVAHVPLRFALRGLVSPLPFLLILAFLQIFINSYKDSGFIFFTIAGDVISLSDLGLGLMIVGRVCDLILILSLGSYTLSTGEITLGLGYLFSPLARLGLPAHDFVMVLQVSLRFLPLLAQTAERIAKSQASRGADWDSRHGGLFARVRRITPIIVPLFLVNLRRAENMALAMDARGYGSVEHRTSRIQLHARPQDWGAALIAFFIAVIILVLP